jgi:D-alanyl-D-alanine dipeptidase
VVALHSVKLQSLLSPFFMKPYQQIPIEDCGEPLVPIPGEQFALVDPPPYAALGAPYGNYSPYSLRTGVLSALKQAQQQLQSWRPGWRIQVFDAFRPIAVQQFMVDYTFQTLLEEKGLQAEQLTAEQQEKILEEVLQFWAIPSSNPATPPPHSTGAALDVTVVDDTGAAVDMGSPIDEVSPRSFPNHFAESPDPYHQKVHAYRRLLYEAMTAAGFRQHPNEWWHFSRGDQLWAWLVRQEKGREDAIARYGSLYS